MISQPTLRFTALYQLSLIVTPFLLLVVTGTAFAATITVNSTGDTNLRDNVLTLREAILFANGTLSFGSLDAGEQGQIDTATNTMRDAIVFNIAGGGSAQTITVSSMLNTISDAVSIDGTTQLGVGMTAPVWPTSRCSSAPSRRSP